MQTWTRRKFLTAGAGGLVLLTGGGVLVRLLNPPNRAVAPSPTASSSQSSARPNYFGVPVPATLPLPLFITRNEDFYSVKFAELPEVGLGSWSLSVHGLVRNELRFTYDDIQSLPSVRAMHTLECIGNPAGGNLIGNAEWRGVSLKSLLDRAGVLDRAQWVVIGGVDEYFTSVPLETAMHKHSMLAYAMNDETLPLTHGYPLRTILPGVYGQKQPKWVTGIKVTDAEELGPWEQKGWSREARIQLNSGIKLPRDAEQLDRQDILIAGVAHAGETEIHSVEISVDSGRTWIDTMLTHGPSRSVWTIWGYAWRNPTPGKYTLMVRARDGNGKSQSEASAGILADEYPNGTSAIHSIAIEIRAV